MLPDYPAPPAATARRLDWIYLPPNLRHWIEEHCGSSVVDAESRDAGFTPGFASVLTCADGRRFFVKAASTKAQRAVADSYREEARILGALPAGVPAPRLLWTLDDDWVVLGIEYVEGDSPTRPWREPDLAAALDALEVVADELTGADLPVVGDVVSEFGPMAEHWTHWALAPLPHREEAAALAAGFVEVGTGSTAVHTDVRADNLLLTPARTVSICDWNWVVSGAEWIDSAMLLAAARGDGLDVDVHLARRPLLRGVPPDHIDRLLAVLTGFYLAMASLPVPHTSPHLRDHQRWNGLACWQWLCDRRGWSPDLGQLLARW